MMMIRVMTMTRKNNDKEDGWTSLSPSHLSDFPNPKTGNGQQRIDPTNVRREKLFVENIINIVGKNYLSRILLILLRKIKPPQPQRQATANKGLLVRETMHDNYSDMRLRSLVIMDDDI